MENYLKEVLNKLNRDILDTNKDFLERLDTLQNMIDSLKLCDCEKGTTPRRKIFLREGRFILAATDGALRIFMGFKRASYAVAFGKYLAASK